MASVGISIISPDALLIRLFSANAFVLVFWRGLFSAIVLLVWLFARKGRGLVGAFRAIGKIGLLASSLHLGAALMFVLALKETAVANVLVITGAQPLVGAILSAIILKERVFRGTWIAAAVVVVGLAVVFWGSLSRGDYLGDLMALAAMSMVALRYVLFRAAREVDMLPTVVLGGFLAAIVLGPFVDTLDVNAKDLLLLAVMGAILLPAGQIMLVAAPRYIPVPEVGLIVLLEAVLAPIWVWLALGEVPSSETVLGGLLILGTLAVYFALMAKRPTR